jgi:hypothetical protein
MHAPSLSDVVLRPRRSQVEGTVLSMLALVGLAYTGHAANLQALVGACTFTVGVYWLANVFAEVLSTDAGAPAPDTLLRSRLRAACAHEAHVFGPSIGLVLTVVVLRAFGVTMSTALWTVLALGCAAMFAWGMLASRRSGGTVFGSIVAGCAGALIGLLVVAAKLIVLH